MILNMRLRQRAVVSDASVTIANEEKQSFINHSYGG